MTNKERLFHLDTIHCILLSNDIDHTFNLRDMKILDKDKNDITEPLLAVSKSKEAEIGSIKDMYYLNLNEKIKNKRMIVAYNIAILIMLFTTIIIATI